MTGRTPTRSETESEGAADGVSPTARWLARGAWKLAAAVALTLLALWLVGLAVRVVAGWNGSVYP